jgi:hypothetical protein
VRRVPPGFRLLAFIGIFIGSIGVLGASSLIRMALEDEEQFQKELANISGPSPSPSPAPAFEFRQRPGVTVPLCAITIILSALLFSGCLLALRGSPWGLSAWRTACVGHLIFTGLLVALSQLPPLDAAVSAIYPLISLWYSGRPQITERFDQGKR